VSAYFISWLTFIAIVYSNYYRVIIGIRLVIRLLIAWTLLIFGLLFCWWSLEMLSVINWHKIGDHIT